MAGLLAAVVVLTISNSRIAQTSRALASALHDKDGALKTARESETLAKASEAEALSQATRAEAGEAQAAAAVDEFLSRVTEERLLKAPGLQALCATFSARHCLRGQIPQSAWRRPKLDRALAGVHLALDRS